MTQMKAAVLAKWPNARAVWNTEVWQTVIEADGRVIGQAISEAYAWANAAASLGSIETKGE